jgi:hypothetical protein
MLAALLLRTKGKRFLYRQPESRSGKLIIDYKVF